MTADLTRALDTTVRDTLAYVKKADPDVPKVSEMTRQLEVSRIA